MTQYVPAHELAELRIDGIITDAEYDVLLLRAKGLTKHTIALALDLHPSSVRDRERNGLRKIELHRRPRKDAA